MQLPVSAAELLDGTAAGEDEAALMDEPDVSGYSAIDPKISVRSYGTRRPESRLSPASRIANPSALRSARSHRCLSIHRWLDSCAKRAARPGVRCRGGSFCVNVLSRDQADLCWRFANSDGADRFADIRWHATPTGCPIIDGVVAWIDCDRHGRHDGGRQDGGARSDRDERGADRAVRCRQRDPARVDPVDREVTAVVAGTQQRGELRQDRSAEELMRVFFTLTNGLLFEHWLDGSALGLDDIPHLAVDFYLEGAVARGGAA